MITENRMKHILGVARQCYNIAKIKGFNEEFCKRMFMIGYVHDVGYEFSADIHGYEGEKLLETIGVSSETVKLAVSNHGSVRESYSDELRILNMADMTVDSQGNVVTALDRITDIGNRYGFDSEVYKRAEELCSILGLL